MPIIKVPPEFDPDYYRRNYPELNICSNDVLQLHYKKFAAEQGRSTCFYDRREHLRATLQKAIDKAHVKTLEISPWDNPFLRGDSVKYFATEDAETLRKSAELAKRRFNKVPEKIHFVSPTGDLGVVDEKFDIVFSAHVIEHTPDFVRHLLGVSKILNKGGVYVLIVPDKRYSFDYYHAETTLAEVIDAFVSKRKNPRLADVINLAFTYTHNNPYRHWLGEHGTRYGEPNKRFSSDAGVEVTGEFFLDDGKGIHRENFLRLIEKYSEAVERGEYISAHNWRFTPDSFRYIVRMLNELQFIDLKIYRCCHTVWGRVEFIAMLEKT